MKSEPVAYSIHDLEKDGRTPWDGVRNYQARNFMRDAMKEGDVVFFYHSNIPQPGIVGEGTVCSSPYPDETAHDPKDAHFDPKSIPENPRWFVVDVCYSTTYPSAITLETIRTDTALKHMRVAQRGNRLSITPVSEKEVARIREYARTA
jgi:predicted RNA-binding protein with PUA-like domain